MEGSSGKTPESSKSMDRNLLMLWAGSDVSCITSIKRNLWVSKWDWTLLYPHVGGRMVDSLVSPLQDSL